MKRRVVFTICSNNYLAHARTFARSWRRFNEEPVFLFLADRVDRAFELRDEPFEVIPVEDLQNTPEIPQMAFRYDILEFNTALKPFAFRSLLGQGGYEEVLYFDPDILVFGALDDLWEAFGRADILLTPHVTTPLPDQKKPTELDILRAGVYNLGFAGFSRTRNAQALLEWWCQKLSEECTIDHARGLHVDQRWMDLAPALADRVAIIRDERHNVAYWNLHNRGSVFRWNGGKPSIGARPLGFFHFSGMSRENLGPISKHQDRFRLGDFPELKPLFETYSSLLAREGSKSAESLPYAFATFENGVTIPAFARRIYSATSTLRVRFPNPFSIGEDSFFEWLRAPVDQGFDGRQGALANFWWEVYKVRHDLQAAYPDARHRDRGAFLEWILRSGVAEYSAPGPFHPAQGAVRTLSGRTGGRIRANPLNLVRPVAARIASRLARGDPVALERMKSVERAARRRMPGRTATGRPPLGRPTRDSSLPFGLNIAGYFSGEFGVAEGARALVRAIRTTKVPHLLTNFVSSGHRSQDPSFSEFTDSNPYRANLINVNADEVPRFYAEKSWYFENRYNIGVWYWELPDFPEIWQDSFRYFSELWATSSFIAETLSRASPVPVVKIPYPLAIDESSLHPDKPKFGMDRNLFTFLFFFDYHSVLERKNPLAVIEAFRRAFGPSRVASLVIKTINSQHYPDRAQAVRDHARDLNVQFIDRHFSSSEMLTLIASADAFVSLHRSEGFGLGMAKAMYLGKPVIATGWSGNMDFMTINNSFPIRYTLVELDRDHGPYMKGSHWAEPDVEHAAQVMGTLADDPGRVAEVARRAQLDVRRQMDPRRVGQVIEARLRQVLDQA